MDLNGAPVQITVTKLSTAQGAPPPPAGSSSPELHTTVVVTPTAAAANTLTTFGYTITVENQGTTARNLNRVHDGLPADFAYVLASTNGVTTADPSVTVVS